MKNSSRQIDRKILKSLEPLNRLNPILLDELAQKSIIEELPAGRLICRHGEKDSRQIYLLGGEVEMVQPGRSDVQIAKSKTPVRTPIAQGSPRSVTLKTKTTSTLLYIDADLLDLLMSDEPELGNNVSAYEVTEIYAEDSEDWMLTFLQSPAFLQLPTENIQKLLTHMKEVSFKKGQPVIKQGDTDDNYYIVKTGSCNVHRKPDANGANVLLAVLPIGSGFGEESLITNGKRNATITMREDGSLMRVKKNDFLNLLVKPVLKYYDHEEAKEKINKGCVIIDVRTQQQAKQQPIERAVNIPLSMLRLKFESLNPGREYLLVCNDSSQSAAAAFLMIQNKLKCSVLRKGLNGSHSNTNNNSNSTLNTTTTNNEYLASSAAKQQLSDLEKQSATTAKQNLIKASREKSKQDVIKLKRELSESRARMVRESKRLKSAQSETVKIKEKAAQELTKTQLESAQRLLEINELRNRENEMLKQSATTAVQARKKAENEAIAIRQRANKEAAILRAEVEAARQKMELDSVRIKQEETTAIRLKSKEDATRLQKDLAETRIKIEAQSARELSKLKQQSQQATDPRPVLTVKEKTPESASKLLYTLNEEPVDYSSVNIPGVVATDILNTNDAKRKAEAIKVRLVQAQSNNLKQDTSQPNSNHAAEQVKVYKQKNKTILEGEKDLFIFKAPDNSNGHVKFTNAHAIQSNEPDFSNVNMEQPTDISAGRTAVAPFNPFLNQERAEPSVKNYLAMPKGNEPDFMVAKKATLSGKQAFNKQTFQKRHSATKSNALAIAASVLMIIAGAIFTLHATDTVKIQSIASLFNSGNDIHRPSTTQNIAKTNDSRKKVLRAKTKVDVKKKVGTNMDNIMQGWKKVLSDSKQPNKLRTDNNK